MRTTRGLQVGRGRARPRPARCRRRRRHLQRARHPRRVQGRAGRAAAGRRAPGVGRSLRDHPHRRPERRAHAGRAGRAATTRPPDETAGAATLRRPARRRRPRRRLLPADRLPRPGCGSPPPARPGPSAASTTSPRRRGPSDRSPSRRRGGHVTPALPHGRPRCGRRRPRPRRSGATAPTTPTTPAPSRTCSSPTRRTSTRPRSSTRVASVLDYADHVLAQGYNAVTVPGFLEYVTFAEVPEVYADDPAYVARAEAVRDAFGPIWQRARRPRARRLPAHRHARPQHAARALPRPTGSTSTRPTPGSGTSTRRRSTSSTPSCPQLSGVVLRIGEGGSIYNTPGLDYYSEISVTTAPAVRAMLDAFTDQAERADKDVVFRTWSVGVGAVGDMHTNPASYDEVLAGIDSPRLVVSTKYSLGDFYSWLPLNDTLEQGTQRRIVELQSRREFESFGSVPNDLGVLHQLALQRFVAANPHVEGIWTWTQDGGPWRAGPDVAAADHAASGSSTTSTPTSPPGSPAIPTPTRPRSPPTGYAAGSPPTPTPSRRSPRRSPCRARRSPTGSTSPSSPRCVPSPSASSRRRRCCSSSGTSSPATAPCSTSSTRSPATPDPTASTEAIDDGQHVIDVATTMRDLVAGTDAATCHDPALREQLRRLARLPGRPPRRARRLPRDGAAPRRSGSTPARDATSGSSARERFDAAAAAARGDVRRRPGAAGLQPHRRADRRGARGPRPADGVARAGRPAGAAPGASA